MFLKRKRDLAGQTFGHHKFISTAPNARWNTICILCGKEDTKRFRDEVEEYSCDCTPMKKVGTTVSGWIIKTYNKLENNYKCACEVCGKERDFTYHTMNNPKKLGKCSHVEKLEKIIIRSNPVTKEKRKQDFISKALSCTDAGRYDYSKVEYVDCEHKVEILCNQCGGSWFARPRLHVTGKGCPSCASSGFKENKQAYFYILQCGPYITKVGISNNKPNVRARTVSRETRENFEVIFEYKTNGSDVYKLEQIVLNYLRSKYQNTSVRFSGYSETFISVERNKLMKYIEEVTSCEKEIYGN